MHDIILMKISEGFQNLIHHVFDVIFFVQIGLGEGWLAQILHHKPTFPDLGVNVECLILDDIGMMESLHDEEVGHESIEVLILKRERLHCVELSSLSFLAFMDDTIATFSKFFH